MQGWATDDTISFHIPITTTAIYHLDLGIRATGDYPYQSVSMLMERKVFHSESKAVRKDTVTCQIAGKDGQLKGKNGISNTELSYRIKDIALQKGDSLCLSISHCMRRRLLPGITDIGIELSRAN